jgi:hypothetical protein
MPMPMPMTMAAYPWDLARVGVDVAVDEIAAAGMHAIEVAANHHTMDVVSPRGGVRMYTSPRGAVVFPVRSSRYHRIIPMTESPEVCGAWVSVADRARARGLALHAAVVPLFQPWIVDAHPDCARVLPTGDPLSQSVCPANPYVRDYLVELCDDLVDRFGVDGLRFQGPMPASYDFDWLRPRSLVRVPSVARELLSACFCDTCVARGVELGLDVEGLRRRVRAAVDADLEHGTTTRGADLARDGELRAYLLDFERAAVELLLAVGGRITAAQQVRISSTAWTPFPQLLADAADEVLGQLVGAVDHVSLTPGWFTERNRRIKPVAAERSTPVALGLVVMGASSVAGALEEAASIGVDDLTLFNWGSLRERDVLEFSSAVRDAFG